MRNLSLVTIVIVFTFLCETRSDESGTDLSKGFGSSIMWMSLENGLKESETSGKPLMLIIHKKWCGACKNLKPLLAESKVFENLSKNFVMVNAEDDEEPQDSKYAPDGSYIPRILFLNKFGEVQNHIINEGGNDKFKYYYSNSESVVRSMERVLAVDENGKDNFFEDIADHIEL